MEKAIKKHAVIFILPTLAAFIIGFIVPFVEGLYLSFCKFTTVGNATWVGLANYRAAITDTSFQRAFGFTVLFAVVSILSINILAFALAVLLTQKLRGTNVFRTVFFMPNLIGGIVLGYIWQILINCVMTILEQPLLALNATAGYWGLIILMGWQQIGYMMIIYIAGLQNVPDSLIEAAEIDGANRLQTLFKIKIPMVMSSITICIFLTLTNSFKLFDQNLALTGGDPNHMTDMMALNIYNTFYARSGMQWKGYGQAKAVIFCALVIFISLFQLRATRSREVQQ
ncbi:MAG TPA: ABC transporter permease [Lachnospiraceae bacterium]|nr:ABC transporter permease [Lachnospiraceae bacterium]